MENGEIEDCAWQDVMTGNLLLVKKDESIPADLVLLSSYDEEGRLIPTLAGWTYFIFTLIFVIHQKNVKI